MGENSKLRSQRLEFEQRDEGDHLHPSNSRAGYQVNEGISIPLQRQAAGVRRENKLAIICKLPVITIPHQRRP